MKKIALALSAFGFLAFAGVVHAQDSAPAGAKPEKASKKKGKKDSAAGDTAAPAPGADTAAPGGATKKDATTPAQ